MATKLMAIEMRTPFCQGNIVNCPIERGTSSITIHIPILLADNYRVTRSKVNLYSNEFEDYQTDIDTSITFCLKELRVCYT